MRKKSIPSSRNFIAICQESGMMATLMYENNEVKGISCPGAAYNLNNSKCWPVFFSDTSFIGYQKTVLHEEMGDWLLCLVFALFQLYLLYP